MRYPRALLAVLLLAERPAMERSLRQAGVLEADVDDLVQEVVLRVLRAIEDGCLVPLTDLAGWRPVIRSYVTTTAWRMGQAWVERRRVHELLDRGVQERVYDPWPWLEARSELRAMDIPEDVLVLLMAIAQGSDLAPFAREIGMSVGTAHDRVRRFRMGVVGRRRG